MLTTSIFNISSPQAFETAALDAFRYQYAHGTIYRKFCQLLKVDPNSVKRITDIPFLPIEFFKSERIISSGRNSEITFTSSGTTSSITSKHHVASLDLYRQSFRRGFHLYYGPPEDWTILALLPSYLEREGSSLIYMVDTLIKDSGNTASGFYLNNLQDLIKTLEHLDKKGKPVLLLGVSYALLDLVEARTFNLKNTTIMETGGMKGRRKEMIRTELHTVLKKGFGVSEIHSEYGMTELLSQAYSKGNGIFACPSWMQVLTRDTEDPFTYVEGKTGGINVIDLANWYSCSFIATQDLGKKHTDGNFEILGRFDTSDIRGCNLMVL
ncbi:MAG: acyl transferase [Bacteroidota bacterium]